MISVHVWEADSVIWNRRNRGVFISGKFRSGLICRRWSCSGIRFSYPPSFDMLLYHRMGHDINQRIDNTVDVEDCDSQYLWHFVTKWYVPKVSYHWWRIRQETGHYDPRSYHQEPSTSLPFSNDDEQHDSVHEDEKEERNEYKTDLLVIVNFWIGSFRAQTSYYL